MPDGTVIKGVPDGTSRSQLQERYGRLVAAKAPKPDLKAENPAEYDPASPEFKAKYGPTGGFGRNAVEGFGKSFVDAGHGLRQLAVEGAEAAGLKKPGRAAELRGIEAERKQIDAPLMSTGGGITGNVAGVAAQTLLPAGVLAKGAQAANLVRTANVARSIALPSTLKGAAAVGAAQGALQPVGTGESRAANVGTGALLGTGGQVAAKTLGRIAQPVKTFLSATQKRAVDLLKREGVPVDLAQQTGSTFLQRAKIGLEGNPFTAGVQATKTEAQGKAFTKAVLRRIGVNADEATEKTLGATRDKLGKVFDEVSAKHAIDIDQRVLGKLSDVQGRASRTLTDDRIGKEIEHVLTKAAQNGGKLDGKAYQTIKGELDQLAMQRDISPLARELREVLDDGLQRAALGTDDFARLKVARTRYGRLLKIADATDETGRISPAKLWQQFNTKGNRAQAKFGKGDQELVSLARAGRAVLTDKMPNSGTAQRLAGQLAIPAIAGTAGQLATGDPSEALKYAALGYAIPRGAQVILNNPRVAGALARGMGPRAKSVLTSPPSRELLRYMALPPLVANTEQQ